MPKKETPLPAGEYNYIKASKQYTIYGMADQGIDMNTIFQKYGKNQKIEIGEDPKKPDISIEYKKANEDPNFIPDESMKILIDKYSNSKMGGDFNNEDFMKSVGASY